MLSRRPKYYDKEGDILQPVDAIFKSGQVDLAGHSSESIVISLINRRDDNHSVPLLLDTDRLEYAELHSKGNHHHWTGPSFNTNILSGKLLISSALLTALCVQKFDTTFLYQIKEHAAADSNYQQTRQKIETGDHKTSPYTVTDELFYWKHRLTVPNNDAIKTEILENEHDLIIARHFGIDKTIELVQRNFYWPAMTNWITDYVQSCDNCITKSRFATRCLASCNRGKRHMSLGYRSQPTS